VAHAAVVAGGAAFVDAGQNSGTANGQDAVVKVLCDGGAEILLDASEFHGREKFSVRELRQTFGLAADAGEFFNVVVPGSDVRITNRPVGGDSLFQIGFEIEIAPAVTLAAPGEGFSANLAATNPGEMFAGIAGIGILLVIDKKLMGVFIAGVVDLALDGLGALALAAIVPATVLEFPNGDVLDIVALGDDRTSRFEDQSIEALFGELFRSPAAGDA